MNSKMTMNSQLSTTEPKEQKLSKLEQEQNQRSGHLMEGFQWGEREGRNSGKKVQGRRSIIDRHK